MLTSWYFKKKDRGRVHHIMEDAGQQLKRARERLNLRFRDVEEASQRIAEKRNSDEFIVALSRLSDIENRGTVPTIFRIYSLSTIYRLDFAEVLEWYGVDLSMAASDSQLFPVEKTHEMQFTSLGHGTVQLPIALDPGIDLRRTTYLSRMIQKWGTLPLMLLNGLDLKTHRYAYIGSDDWFMHPILQPGTLILIDETRRKAIPTGWTGEYERPIYFFEHRNGFACAWCNLVEKQMYLIPHPASQCDPEVYSYPEEIDIIGQVVGVAMRLDPPKRRRLRP